MVTLTVEHCGEASGIVADVTTGPSPREVLDVIAQMSSGLLEVHLEQASGSVLSIASSSNSYFLAFFDAGDGPYHQAVGQSSDATVMMFIGGSVVEMTAPYLLTLDVALETALAFLSDDGRPRNVEWEQLS